MSDTRGYLRKTKFLSTNIIKMTWATPGFQNFTWEVTLCAAATPKHAVVTTENFFRWKQMIWLCGTYFYFENHQCALVELDRKDFHEELVEKSCSGYRVNGRKRLVFRLIKKSKRWMLLSKVETSHKSLGLLLPRSVSRLNKSHVHNEIFERPDLHRKRTESLIHTCFIFFRTSFILLFFTSH